MADFLQHVDADVVAKVPDRQDGYGLTVRAVREFRAQGVGLIITVDNGIAAIEAATEAARLGVGLIVTDHHRRGPVLPQALALVHPSLADDYSGTWRDACGAGVALGFAIVLRRALREIGAFSDGGEPVLEDALQLAAIGTIADVVPLAGVNRIIVREGLSRMRRSPTAAIAALLRVSKVSAATADEETVAFAIAPRLNAAGRVGSAMLALNCLMCRDPIAASAGAAQLDLANQARKRIEDKVMAELGRALGSAQEPASLIFAAHPDWNHGVLGIVAGRIAREFDLPTILFQIQAGTAKGSARGVPGFDLMAALEAGRPFCESLGGHKDAAGMTVALNNLQAFRNAIAPTFSAGLSTLGPATLDLDGVVPMVDVGPALVDELARFAPFGAGNPRPLFASETIQLERAYVLKQKHLSFRIQTGAGLVSGIGFGLSNRMPVTTGKIQIAYRPAWDYYRGNGAIQIVCEEMRPSIV